MSVAPLVANIDLKIRHRAHSRDSCSYGARSNAAHLPGLADALAAAGLDVSGNRCAAQGTYSVRADGSPSVTSWPCCEQHLAQTIIRVRIESHYVQRFNRGDFNEGG